MSIDMTAQDTQPRLASAKDYVELMKPRIMMLVVFTALAGLVAAVGVTGQGINPVLAPQARSICGTIPILTRSWCAPRRAQSRLAPCRAVKPSQWG